MESNKQTINWLLYHEPVDLFLRTAEAFSKEIAELTDGRISINVYTQAEYADKFNNGVIHNPKSLLESNQVQMSQFQMKDLGHSYSPDFFALELPFLFKTHEHATSVLEGEIGKGMLNSLAKKTPVKGLAFTYSGGYRVIVSNREITAVEDFKGMRMNLKAANPIFLEMAKSLGCDVSVLSEDSQNCDTVQTTLPRYQTECDASVHKYVVNTQHSMYLTTIIINNDFWNTLSVSDQLAMQTAALNSSRLEREWTVQDSEKIENSEEERTRLGISKMYGLSDNESEKFRNCVTPVYDKFKMAFTPGLVDAIRNTH